MYYSFKHFFKCFIVNMLALLNQPINAEQFIDWIKEEC